MIESKARAALAPQPEISLCGPVGKRPLIYADYVASGRADASIEKIISSQILPYYANTHSKSSFCGEHTTRMRENARDSIHKLTQARPEDIVVFAGSGATGALAVLLHELRSNPNEDFKKQPRPLVVVGPYEHHSNLLPWRESGAEVIEISEAAKGGPELDQLNRILSKNAGTRRIIGSFSVASNITGTLTDVATVSRLLHQAGALAIWDYAAAAPYVEIAIDKGPREEQPDAIVFSPHKFVGGPGASGVLVADGKLFTSTSPRFPGGGTVAFVSPWVHDYSKSAIARSEPGTPNILGDIRAALVMMLKAETPQAARDARLAELSSRPLSVWKRNPAISILGIADAPRLPIFSLVILKRNGQVFSQTLFARMLSDLYGIQVRSGWACAGSYGHALLSIDKARSSAIRRRIGQGDMTARPGFVRLNLSAEMSDETISYIIEAVNELAGTAEEQAAAYKTDAQGQIRHQSDINGSAPTLWEYFRSSGQ